MIRPLYVKMLALLAVAVLIAGCGSSHQSTDTSTAAQARQTPGATHSALPESSSPNEHARKANYIVAVATIQLAHPLVQYTVYVNRLVKRLPSQVSAIETAAKNGNLGAAEDAWLPAHVTYLEIGQDDAAYGAFGDLGQQIDGLAAGLPNTTANPKFTGFHKLELDLWTKHDTTAAATDAKQLLTFVDKLTPKAVAADLPLQTLAIDAWVLRCHEILEDALRDSLTQDDDYGSNTDLASISADVTATREMLNVLAPLIAPRMPKIVPTGKVQLTAIDQAVAGAGGPDAHRDLASLPARQRQAIDEAVGAATETLAPVSEILQASTPGS